MRGEVTGLQRREFLKGGVLAAAGSAALGGGVVAAAATSDEPAPAARALPTRPFGKTGQTLPILGMGGSAMVVRFIGSYGVKLLPVDDRVAMVRHAYDRGIRYFDTARGYGESESIMGKGLQGLRQQVFLATKVAETIPSRVRPSVEKSLKELDIESLDLVQIHSPAIEKVGFQKAMKLHAELVKLRDEKLLRFIGLTTHVAFETVYQMIDTAGFDQVLLAYGYFRKGMNTLHSNRNLELRELCLAKASELNMAIVAMKVMGASVLGHNARNVVPDYDPQALGRLPGAAIRWVLQDRRIAMLNIGVSMPEDIDRNVATLKGGLTLSDEDRLLLADFAGRAYQSPPFSKMPVV